MEKLDFFLVGSERCGWFLDCHLEFMLWMCGEEPAAGIWLYVIWLIFIFKWRNCLAASALGYEKKKLLKAIIHLPSLYCIWLKYFLISVYVSLPSLYVLWRTTICLLQWVSTHSWVVLICAISISKNWAHSGDIVYIACFPFMDTVGIYFWISLGM